MKQINKILIILVGFFITTTTFAEETNLEIAIGQWSYHFDKKMEYNEKHDLFGIQYNRWTAATFINSEGHRSYSVGRVISFDKMVYNRVEPRINILLVNGYERVDILPIAIFTSLIHLTDHLAIDINVLPFVFASTGFRIMF